MSVEDEFAARVRARREKAFAGDVRMRGRNAEGFTKRTQARGSGAFAGQLQRRAGETFTGQLQRRTGETFTGQLQGRTSETFARHIMNGSVMWSAARMRGRGISPGADLFPGIPLIFLKQRGRTSADNHYYRLLLRLNQTWRNSYMSKQECAVYRDTLALHIVKRLERFFTNRKLFSPEESVRQIFHKSLRNTGASFRTKDVCHGQHSAQKELGVFRNIATIFVNRGSRPDLAKKAERELVKILSRTYHENNPEKQPKETHVYQRQITHEELVMTKRTVTELQEQVKKQKTLLFQLQKNMESIRTTPEPDLSKITGEVMKRMEREMHLERLRRGM